MELAIPEKSKRVVYLKYHKDIIPFRVTEDQGCLFFFFLVSMRYYPGGQEEKRRVQMRKRGGNGSKTSYCA